MKTKELLSEWKSFLEKELLNEISIQRFQEQHPDFDTSGFSPQLRGNTDYLDIIKNSIEAGEQHSPDDYVQQFDFYKNSIEPNRKNKDFLTVNVPGGDTVSLDNKLNQGSCTATYNDIQQFQQARLEIGKGSKNKLANVYIKALEEASESNFELVAENNEWIIFYPKSIVGSIALARSYWDGNKVTYDNTFQASKGFGQNTGVINWCTSVSGGGNMFLNYHRRLNLHMYYCIKKNLRSIKDKNRKLCISLSKKNNKVKYLTGQASVNGNNSKLPERSAQNYIGSLYDVLIRDAKKSTRLEIDEESYYRSISLEQYLIMKAANEENINDFLPEFKNILKYSKDSEKISKVCVEDNLEIIRVWIASDPHVNPNILSVLAKDDSEKVRIRLATNMNINPDTFRILAKDDSEKVKSSVSFNENSPPDALQDLAKNGTENIRAQVAVNPNTSPDTLRFLAKDDSEKVKNNVAGNRNTPQDVIQDLAKNGSEYIKIQIAFNRNTPPDLFEDLAKSDSERIKRVVAFNRSTPPSTLRYLANNESNVIREKVAKNLNTPPDILEDFAKKGYRKIQTIVASNSSTPPDVLRYLASKRIESIKSRVASNLSTPPDVLEDLAKNGSENTKIQVATNHSSPSNVLEYLAYNGSEQTRIRVVWNSNTPLTVLKDLAKNDLDDVRDNAIDKLENDYNIRLESVLKQYIKLIMS